MKHNKTRGNLKKKILLVMLVSVNIFYCSLNSYCQDCSKVQIDKFTKEKTAVLDIYKYKNFKLFEFRIQSVYKNIYQIFVYEYDYIENIDRPILWDKDQHWRSHKLQCNARLYLLFDDNESIALTADCNPDPKLDGVFPYIQFTFENDSYEGKLVPYLKTHKVTDIRIDGDIHLTEDQQSFFKDVIICIDNL